MATIAVAGLWHLGTVLCACLAELEHVVRGVDVDVQTVADLLAGRSPVYEPELDCMLQQWLDRRRLSFTTDFRLALTDTEFVFIALDTPLGEADEPVLDQVFAVTRRIGDVVSGSPIVIVASQVPVGTCDRIAAMLESASRICPVVYVPEFLQLGNAVDSFRRADRFVVGAEDPGIATQVAALYEPLGRPIVTTDRRTAEMAKHASNIFLATSISAINEIADLCEEVGADAVKVAEIMKLDRRIGKDAYLTPGLGFAGGTLVRDIRALQQAGERHGIQTRLIDAVIGVNRSRERLVVQRLRRVYSSLAGLRVAILGLTYKLGTSTLRRSIALEIITDLVAERVNVHAFDPLVELQGVDTLPAFELFSDPYAAAQGCDAAVLMTPWNGMEALDWRRLRGEMRRPVFIDTRNLLDPRGMYEAGFVYLGIGRASWSHKLTTGE